MNKHYTISAYDMLFFGDGRPFSMTETETWTQGIFPPMPSTIYGFLRSIYFENNMSDLANANKVNDPTKNLKVKSYSLGTSNNEALYPIPACFLSKKDMNGNIEIYKLEFKEQTLQTSSDFPYKLYANEDGKLDSLDINYYITKKQLENFLKGNSITKALKIQDSLTPVDRLGITKNYLTGKPEDGRLYRMQLNETNVITENLKDETNVFFNIEIEGLDSLSNSHIRNLGGEGKTAILKENEMNFDVELPENINDMAIIYFATAGIFKDAYYPKKLFENYAIKLLFMANNNPTYVSGWDIEKRTPKTAQKVLPAGTLLFIEFTNTEYKKHFIEQYQGNQLPYSQQDKYSKQGFNKTYIGNY